MEKDGEIIYEGEVIDSLETQGGKLYLSTKRGFVYCLDSVERKILWRFMASEPLASPSYCGSKKIYFYDQGNTLYCLDKEGKALWKKKFEEEITSGLAEFDNKICFGTEKGTFFALSADRGEVLWHFQAGGAIRTTPVFAGNKIIFGGDSFGLTFLTEEGRLLAQIRANDTIQATPLVEKNFIYFGADDHYFYCFNLKKGKMKWRIKTGGKFSTPPAVDEKRIFFLCWNDVLYCLNKRNGHILWWKIIPSRSFYRLEVSGKRIVVSSLSSLLLCFEMGTGEKVGDYEASQEVKSNPLWLPPYLVFNLYDSQSEKGRLVFLRTVIKVSLTASQQSPQAVGEEIAFTVSAVGFYKPKYEFYIIEGDEKKVVQEKSEKKSWSWFPEKQGDFVIGVEVFDEKQSMKKEIPFEIKKE